MLNARQSAVPLFEAELQRLIANKNMIAVLSDDLGTASGAQEQETNAQTKREHYAALRKQRPRSALDFAQVPSLPLLPGFGFHVGSAKHA